MPKNFERSAAEVLLVEDNEGDALLTREALAESPVRVSLHRARDGFEALAFLHREGEHAGAVRPDLILLDLNMPRMDGREFLEIVKGDEELRGLPVIVLTTSAAERDIVASYRLHASCYLQKPMDFGQFQALMRQVGEFWFGFARLPVDGSR